MTVNYNTLLGSYEYTCIYGCYGGDFATENDADDADLEHVCHPDVA